MQLEDMLRRMPRVMVAHRLRLVGVVHGFRPTGKGGTRYMPHLCWLSDVNGDELAFYRSHTLICMGGLAPTYDAHWAKADCLDYQIRPLTVGDLVAADGGDGRTWMKVTSGPTSDDPENDPLAWPGDIGVLHRMAGEPMFVVRDPKWSVPPALPGDAHLG